MITQAYWKHSLMAVAEEHEAIGAQSGSTICPGTS